MVRLLFPARAVSIAADVYKKEGRERERERERERIDFLFAFIFVLAQRARQDISRALPLSCLSREKERELIGCIPFGLMVYLFRACIYESETAKCNPPLFIRMN